MGSQHEMGAAWDVIDLLEIDGRQGRTARGIRGVKRGSTCGGGSVSVVGERVAATAGGIGLLELLRWAQGVRAARPPADCCR